MKREMRVKWKLRLNWPLYAMMIPAIVLTLIFSYYPMYGLVIAFKNYNPGKGIFGSSWAGLKYFQQLFDNPDIWSIIRNTFVIALGKVVCITLAAILFALLLNEIKQKRIKRYVQTVVYLPNFLSWVVIGGIFIDLLGSNGIVNRLIVALGGKTTLFLGNNTTFQWTMILTDVWKSFGWSSIIYIAALTGINPELYESCMLDGANRLQQTWHVTLPGIASTIALLACLSLGNLMSAGFEQILVLYSPIVYETGDILDTFLYRAGLIEAQFSLATATGLIKSMVGLILIAGSYYLANRFTGYTIF